MKCPKCGYNSFEFLDNCKKCGQGLGEHKQKFNLWGFFSEQEPQAPSSVEPEPANPAVDENEPDDDLIDFGFDFLNDIDDQNDQNDQITQQETLNSSDDDISIYQPFDDNNENVPDDNNLSDSSDSNDKPGKGPEFAF